MDLHGKVTLVTGAAKRVGRAIALALAEAGSDIAIHYNGSEIAAAEVAGAAEKMGRRALLVRADLTDPAAPDRLVAQVLAGLGRIDVLINNASTFEKRSLADTDAAFWMNTLQVNLLAPALLARVAGLVMRDAGEGRIINLADILADRPAKGYAAYCTSKAGLAGLTRVLARELAPHVTVNAVAPGIAEFPDDFDEETRERLIAQVPLQRAGTPAEVASLVRYLVTSANYITGQVIPIDGGRSIRP